MKKDQEKHTVLVQIIYFYYLSYITWNFFSTHVQDDGEGNGYVGGDKITGSDELIVVMTAMMRVMMRLMVMTMMMMTLMVMMILMVVMRVIVVMRLMIMMRLMVMRLMGVIRPLVLMRLMVVIRLLLNVAMFSTQYYQGTKYAVTCLGLIIESSMLKPFF